MQLGDLKKALAKYPPDMNDIEVMVVVSRKGKRQAEPLCFVGYLPKQGLEHVVLGTLTEVQRMVENGELEKPEGYIGPEETDSRLFDEGEDGH